ncbi:hypothetical protein BCR32DRAFT_273241 [Anaeromyces robustus]|uniref:[histone H4]-N-methyl-L-lysine(20) N-methyltransferase n=1 Tax=Anaeromyces robustus TaxID=1754192 RepID=A0A1Y1VSB6_9FUNG|nr:hypothetical protein BCR32DRAFT_273241 [Anaeromyces robustus]|eukprot:ORX64063.1 hypothetical protein BCR32DRAFT_273241 [Anaeromyces robustus]
MEYYEDSNDDNSLLEYNSSDDQKSRRTPFSKRILKETEAIDCPELCQFDDILCDILIDNLFLGFRTHKLNKFNEKSFSPPPKYDEENNFSEAILDIIKKNILNVDIKDGVDSAFNDLYSLLTSETLDKNYNLSSLISTKLIKYPTFKEYFNSLSQAENDYFVDHAKRYLSMYHPKAGYQLIETNRYKSTGKKECCLIATKAWHKGDFLKYCSGILCPISNEELKNMKEQDFSIMFATSLQCNALFLGPGRFMNHDCQPNCEFISINKTTPTVNFKIIRDVNIGEELTVFYSDSYFGTNNCDCLCESCEKKQLGGFSKPLYEEITTSESEKESNLGHPISSVMRHRRRAQPISFKKLYKNDSLNRCSICNRIQSKLKSRESSFVCEGCLRHKKIYELNWPFREKEKKNKKSDEPSHLDDLSDFKDLFFKSIYNKQVDDSYDCLYDFYNKKLTGDTILNNNNDNSVKNPNSKESILSDNNRKELKEEYDNGHSLLSNNINKENGNNERNVNDYNSKINNPLIDFSYGHNNIRKKYRKRRLILDDYIKMMNRTATKRRYTMYDASPSHQSYDSVIYFGFSDYIIGLESENQQEYNLFNEISEKIRKYKSNEKKLNTHNLLNFSLPVKNSLNKQNPIINDKKYIYIDPLITPELICKTLFDDNLEERTKYSLNGINIEFIRNSYNRRKLVKYTTYEDKEVESINKLNNKCKYIGINTFLLKLYDAYKNHWESIHNNDLVSLNNNMLTNTKYYNNLNTVKLYHINEIVDCFSEYGWYKAEILKIEFDDKNVPKYYIHYLKWSVKYDVWVHSSQLRKPHEESDNLIQNATLGNR